MKIAILPVIISKFMGNLTKTSTYFGHYSNIPEAYEIISLFPSPGTKADFTFRKKSFEGRILFFVLYMMGIANNFSLTDGAMETSDNFSDDRMLYMTEPKFSVTFLLLLVVSGITVFTNALILAAFYVEKKLRTYNNYYILNMTIADFVVGLVCMPLRSTVSFYNVWNFGKVTSILFMGFQNFILSVSVCGMVVICMDRYIATFYPIKHFQRKSIRKATAVNILTWILSFGMWIMISCVWDFIKPTDELSFSGFSRPNYTMTKTASTIVFILRFVFPFFFITGLYLRIYFRVRSLCNARMSSKVRKDHLGKKKTREYNEQHPKSSTSPANKMGVDENSQFNCSQSSETKDILKISNISLHVSTSTTITSLENGKIYPSSEGSEKQYGKSINEDFILEGHKSQPTSINDVAKKFQRESTAESHKAMRTLTFVILAFAITWLPNAFNVMIYSMSSNLYNAITRVVNLHEVTRWISYSNSLFNPVAYAMAQPLIRDTVVKILRCKCFKE